VTIVQPVCIGIYTRSKTQQSPINLT
jgi:hypothetical protein